jgi:mediator of RNA polymerase II transcription subunit 18, fungi type
MPEPSTLTALDPSDAYLLQASVRVADGAQPELLAQGGSELTALRTALKGVVELEPGDRMALDTRVKI